MNLFDAGIHRASLIIIFFIIRQSNSNGLQHHVCARIAQNLSISASNKAQGLCAMNGDFRHRLLFGKRIHPAPALPLPAPHGRGGVFQGGQSGLACHHILHLYKTIDDFQSFHHVRWMAQGIGYQGIRRLRLVPASLRR
ncbi:MAG: hypothetical protein WA435_01520 [Gallionellaceae bacterium]